MLPWFRIFITVTNIQTELKTKKKSSLHTVVICSADFCPNDPVEKILEVYRDQTTKGNYNLSF